MRKHLALAVVVLGAGAALASPAQAHHRDDGPRLTGLTTAGDLVVFSAASPKAVERAGRMPQVLAGVADDTQPVGTTWTTRTAPPPRARRPPTAR